LSFEPHAFLALVIDLGGNEQLTAGGERI
jgi:hypothetical protein